MTAPDSDAPAEQKIYQGLLTEEGLREIREKFDSRPHNYYRYVQSLASPDPNVCQKCGSNNTVKIFQFATFNAETVQALVPPGIEAPKPPLKSTIFACHCGHEWEVKKP